MVSPGDQQVAGCCAWPLACLRAPIAAELPESTDLGDSGSATLLNQFCVQAKFVAQALVIGGGIFVRALGEAYQKALISKKTAEPPVAVSRTR